MVVSSDCTGTHYAKQDLLQWRGGLAQSKSGGFFRAVITRGTWRRGFGRRFVCWQWRFGRGVWRWYGWEWAVLADFGWRWVTYNIAAKCMRMRAKS